MCMAVLLMYILYAATFELWLVSRHQIFLIVFLKILAIATVCDSFQNKVT